MEMKEMLLFSVGQAADAEQEQDFVRRIAKKFRHDVQAAMDPDSVRDIHLKEQIAKKRLRLQTVHNTVER